MKELNKIIKLLKNTWKEEALEDEWEKKKKELLDENSEFRREVERRAKEAGIGEVKMSWAKDVEGFGLDVSGGSENIVDDIILHSQ